MKARIGTTRLEDVLTEEDFRGARPLKFISPYDRVLFYHFSGQSAMARKELLQFCRDYNYRFFRPGVTYEQVFKRLSGKNPKLVTAHFVQFLKEDLKGTLEFYKKAYPQAGEDMYAFLFEVLNEPDEEARARLWEENKDLVLKFVKANSGALLAQLSARTIRSGINSLPRFQPRFAFYSWGAIITYALASLAFKEGFYASSFFIFLIAFSGWTKLAYEELFVGIPRKAVGKLKKLYE